MATDRYQRIYCKMWTDVKFKTLSDDAKLLFNYLLSSPHSNILGYYVCPKGYILGDLSWEPKRLGKPFNELLDKGFIKQFEEGSILYIVNQLKYNPIENPNQVKHALKMLELVPISPLENDLINQINQADKPFMKPLMERLLNRLANPLPNPLPLPLPLPKEKDSCPNEKKNQNDFEKFWQVYPKKRARPDAEKAWDKVVKLPDFNLQVIIESLERQKKSLDWTKDNGQFIPFPATWLNGKRWLDEIKIDAIKPMTKVESCNDYIEKMKQGYVYNGD